MSLPTTRDILASWPGWATVTLDRFDESFVTGGGSFNVTEVADPLWHLKAQTKDLLPSEIRSWEAALEGLDGGKAQLYGYDLSSRYPISYPVGTWPTGGAFNGLTAQIHTIDAGLKLVRLKLLPPAFTLVRGDLFSFKYASGQKLALHRVMETVVADGSGITPLFEIRPHIRTGALANDVVAVKQPQCVMAMIPKSLSKDVGLDGRGKLSFEALQIFEAF